MEARKQIVKDLEEGGYLVKVEPLKHNVGTCYRCHTVVEPRVSTQWFVKMEPLAGPAIDVVKDGAIQLDSRAVGKDLLQLDGEHQGLVHLPAAVVGPPHPRLVLRGLRRDHRLRNRRRAPAPSAAASTSTRTSDTLDTWFSSALWPFSTLGWPDNTPELEYFYPTNTLVTGYDIIFFWVARMIFSGLEHTGKAPFNTVLYPRPGAGCPGPEDEQVPGQRHRPRWRSSTSTAPTLCALPWSPAIQPRQRHALLRREGGRQPELRQQDLERRPVYPDEHRRPRRALRPARGPLTLEDQWIVSRFNTVVKEVTENLDKFELGMAVSEAVRLHLGRLLRLVH